MATPRVREQLLPGKAKEMGISVRYIVSIIYHFEGGEEYDAAACGGAFSAIEIEHGAYMSGLTRYLRRTTYPVIFALRYEVPTMRVV